MKKHSFRTHIGIFCCFLLLSFFACTTTQSPTVLPEPVVRVTLTTPTQIPSPTASPTVTLTPTKTPIPDRISTLTPTPDLYRQMYMESLKTRIYGGGVLQNEGLLTSPSGFSRYLFKYRSEGLNLYGFINIPNGSGTFPVVIVLHGAVDTLQYTTVGYTARYSDALTQAGYIVINPNLRGYLPSEDEDNDFGVGDAIDILNLIALIRSQSGVPGLLEKADPQNIGLMGHSMGGAIVLRAMIVDSQVKAGVLYASVNADEHLNLVHFGNDGRREKKLFYTEDVLKAISPTGFLDAINAPLSIHHGSEDAVVPVEWSRDLCQQLQEMGKTVECFLYPEQLHTFQYGGDTLFIQRMITFFNQNLK